MALSSCPTQPMLIVDSSLEEWTVIGSGGFGQIFKARHRQWCCDVAIKVLHHDDGSSKSLLREIDMMRQGSSPYVIHVHGVFKGRVPSLASVQLGLVMEFMERGCLASLQKTLRESPPWPLVFRLAHQVALGINFLHSLSPPLLHLDLKPSNVLLDSYLNAKLTDFGLARFDHSVTRVSKKDSDEEGGTISYMPPEAFDLLYRPTRASDIYSYGILLWSIVTGKKPYPNAMSTMVRLRIPQGDRPLLDEIRGQAAVHAGLTGLMELMEKCWEARPNQRPSSHDCTTVTEELYKVHKHGIFDAVHRVLQKLEEEGIIAMVEKVHIAQVSGSKRVEEISVCDNVLTGGPPIQEMAGGWAANQRDQARSKDSPSPQPAGVRNIDMCRSVTDHKVKVSSVLPIHSSPSSPSTERAPQSTPSKTSLAFKQNLLPQCHRQLSSPDTFPCHPLPPVHGVHIHLSHVIGFQQGNNNTMHIHDPHLLDRKRHPTAPSRVNLPPPHS